MGNEKFKSFSKGFMLKKHTTSFVIIIGIFFSAFDVNQSNLKLIKTDVIENYNFYHVLNNTDSLVIISQRFYDQKSINNINLDKAQKIKRLQFQNDSLFFRYKIGVLSKGYERMITSFQPGVKINEYYTYRSFPYFVP
ncbi:hypothetical protein [Nonlabens ponticola]|uniref:hypothetical protein n=1 Tax=Nonlabens ponticola TaxID=2496866 RepID=UPI0019D1BFE1|nr:hypothetical protein [Nonlabens ponticola]